MPLKLPREVQQYHDRAIDSIRLAIEHFNRPSENGRREAVLHFALHSHEMLAKAILRERGRTIQGRRDAKTISFEKCLNLLDESGEKVIDADDKLSLVALSNARGMAQHSIIRLSEQELYLHVQAAVTVCDRLLKGVFNESLADFLPNRVLPVSTEPPMSMELLIDSESAQIKDLLQPGRRRSADAKARLRALLAIDLAAADQHRPPTPLEVDRAAARLKAGRAWKDVFPNLASVHLDTSGSGQTYSVRMTKQADATPARFAESEDDVGSAAIIREINYFDKFGIKLTEFGERLGLSRYQGLAVIHALDIKENSDEYYCRLTTLGNIVFQGLSSAALERARTAIQSGELSVQDAVAGYNGRLK